VRLGQYLLVANLVYLAFRVQDLTYRGAWRDVVAGGYETVFFLVENALFGVPVVLLLHPGWRRRPRLLVTSGFLLTAAVVLHRLNVTIVGMRRGTGSEYFPTWQEVWISVFLVVCGALVFGLAARYLPVFEREAEHESAAGPAGGGPADRGGGPSGRPQPVHG
jgi:Ni/Fe-hydrogenase subunit HybB-like protein